MILDAKAMSTLLAEASKADCDVAAYVTEQLKQVEYTENAIVTLHREMNEHAKRMNEHAKRVDHINRDIAEVRKQCKHRQTTFHGDPSGGRDSQRTCDVCGAELNRARLAVVRCGDDQGSKRGALSMNVSYIKQELETTQRLLVALEERNAGFVLQPPMTALIQSLKNQCIIMEELLRKEAADA